MGVHPEQTARAGRLFSQTPSTAHYHSLQPDSLAEMMDTIDTNVSARSCVAVSG